MKILLFGGEGQLGFEIRRRASDLNFEIISPVLSELNIADEPQVLRLARLVKPEIVLNCAAYTAVDKAESEKEEAFLINRDGAAHIAQAAKDVGARMFHISTDYVFGEGHTEPIPEDAPTDPPNVYGASKLAGEKEIQRILSGKGVIVRTSSLHGQKGVNFVHTMIGLFRERERVSVVNDQFMSPTWAGWFSEVLLDLVRIECSGVLHACCCGVISWYDFAQEILKQVSPSLPEGHKVTVEPIAARDYPRPARRASYSAMACEKLERLLGRPRLPWQEGLAAHLAEIGYVKS